MGNQEIGAAFLCPSILICWPRYSKSSTFIFSWAPSSFPTLLSRKQEKPHCNAVPTSAMVTEITRSNLVVMCCKLGKCSRALRIVPMFSKAPLAAFSQTPRRTLLSSPFLFPFLLFSPSRPKLYSASSHPNPFYWLSLRLPVLASPFLRA